MVKAAGAEFSDGEGESDNDLADVASSAQQDVTDTEGSAVPAQARFKGTDYSKLKFNGVQQDVLETDLKRGDKVRAIVEGIVTGIHDDTMADGHVRHTLVVKVQSVALPDEPEA